MEKKFKESVCCADISRMITGAEHFLGETTVPRVTKVIFTAISNCLASIKKKNEAQALVFRRLDGTFIAAAKIEYIGNPDDASNDAAGAWSYTMSFYEDDIQDAHVIDVSTSNLFMNFIDAAGLNLYNMKFQDQPIAIAIANFVFEAIKKCLQDNASPTEMFKLTFDNIFTAMSSVTDGATELGIVPGSEMKVLIKDDGLIQEN